MVGRVSYLDRVKQDNYHNHVKKKTKTKKQKKQQQQKKKTTKKKKKKHTEPKLDTSQIISFHNNLPYPPPYFGYPDWESVTLCKYQHYPTLDTTYPYPSIVIPYPSTYPTLPTVGKIPLPTLSIYPTYPIHVTLACIPVPTSHYLLSHTPTTISLPYTIARA